MASLPPQRRWRRWLVWTTAALGVLMGVVVFCVWDDVRTLRSLRRVEGTNAFVMDYYANYNMEEIRQRGIDVENVEESFLEVYFPDLLLPVARRLRDHFMDQELGTVAATHRCSSLVFENNAGEVFFGRNFDWKHDAFLILRMHQGGEVTSVAVIDLAYLNLDRGDLEETSLFERIPLLFKEAWIAPLEG